MQTGTTAQKVSRMDQKKANLDLRLVFQELLLVLQQLHLDVIILRTAVSTRQQKCATGAIDKTKVFEMRRKFRKRLHGAKKVAE